MDDPVYRVVTAYKPAAKPGMPGPYPGQVIRVHSGNSIDTASDKVYPAVVKRMISSGMKSLTGDARDEDAWARFITPKDVVGIKVNCSGAPRICSAPEIVGEIGAKLVAVGVPAKQIYVYERFDNQLRTVDYGKYLPAGAKVVAAELHAARYSGTIRGLTWRPTSSAKKIRGPTWHAWSPKP